MKYIKHIGLICVVFVCLFLYASSSISRSLYSTKADANVDYQTIGAPKQQMTIQQNFTVSNSHIKQIVVKTRPYTNDEPTQITWTLQDDKGGVLVTGIQTLEKKTPYQDTFIVSLPNLSLQKNSIYRISFSGQIGNVFMKTSSGENNKGIVVDGVNENMALTTKLVYGGFHTETFIVLVGLIIYILLFMKGMTTLFK